MSDESVDLSVDKPLMDSAYQEDNLNSADSFEEPKNNSNRKRIGDESYNNFNDISTLIANAEEGGTIELSGTYIGNGSSIPIDKSLTINGNGATLDAKGMSSAFYINAQDIVLKDISFVNCASEDAGAIYFRGNNCSISNCNFTNNRATIEGGALTVLGNSASFKNCNFFTNSCISNNFIEGGTLYLDLANSSIIDCNFISNISTSDNTSHHVNSAIYLQGNGKYSIKNSCFKYTNILSSYHYSSYDIIDCDFYLSENSIFSINTSSVINCSFVNSSLNGQNALINNCKFLNSSACGYEDYDSNIGNYLYNFSVIDCSFINSALLTPKLVKNCYFTKNIGDNYYNSVIYLVGNSSISNCNFTDNKCRAIHADGGINCIIGNCSFINNNIAYAENRSFSSGGGAIYIYGGDSIIADSIFINNSAISNQYIDNYGAPGGGGGAIELHNANYTIKNCNFTNNSNIDSNGIGELYGEQYPFLMIIINFISPIILQIS